MPEDTLEPTHRARVLWEVTGTLELGAFLCELSNAHLRTHHGVSQFLLRGVDKVTNVVLFAAIASNLLQHAATLIR